MPSGFEITCANRNAHGMIEMVGGPGWSLGAREAIVKLISQQVRLHIHVDGQPIEVGVRGDGFDSYLALEPNGLPLHDLVDLASC